MMSTLERLLIKEGAAGGADGLRQRRQDRGLACRANWHSASQPRFDEWKSKPRSSPLEPAAPLASARRRPLRADGDQIGTDCLEGRDRRRGFRA
jgi:hypothetical protein